MSGYGTTVILGLTIHDIDPVEAGVFTLLAIGEVTPSYEEQLGTLGVEYIAMQDESGGQAFGSVEDFAAFGNGDISAQKLRNRLFFEGI